MLCRVSTIECVSGNSCSLLMSSVIVRYNASFSTYNLSEISICDMSFKVGISIFNVFFTITFSSSVILNKSIHNVDSLILRNLNAVY